MPPRKSKKESRSRVTSVEPSSMEVDDDGLIPPSKEKRADDDDEEEEEDDDDDGMGLGISRNTALPANGQEQPNEISADLEREKMNLLLANFNEDQMSRYEAYRRANINRNGVKKLANAILNQSITPNVAVALSGMSKVFVGEVVERARDVQIRMNQPKSFEEYENAPPEPLKPEHLREAWRLMKLETGTVPNAHWRRQGGADGLMFR